MRVPDAKDTLWQRWFPWVLVSLWVLTPEARRLIDWQIGFNSLSILSLIPILSMLPLVGIFFGSKRITLPRDFAAIVVLWVGGFAYALLVAFLSGGLLGALYDATLFCVPVMVGLWLTTMDAGAARRVFDRFAWAALVLGTITSVYGVLQFIAPPPWDVAWVYNSELGSIGQPVPFGLRIFATLNSPGVLSDFLAMTILLTLHRMRSTTIWLIAPLFCCTLALALTFGRTGWLELAVGFVVYSVLSPRRAPALATVGAAAVLTLLLGANLSLITGDASSNAQLQNRLSTFNNIQNDESANDREQQTSVAMRQALAEPLGQGLGTIGTATKLSSAGSTTVLDNGYLMRFLEMGVFGFSLYIAALVGALICSLARLPSVYARRDTDPLAAPLLATSIAIQVALIGADLSGDHHSALLAIVFWLVLGLTSTIRKDAVRRSAFATGGEPTIHQPARA